MDYGPTVPCRGLPLTDQLATPCGRKKRNQERTQNGPNFNLETTLPEVGSKGLAKENVDYSKYYDF
eukprot:scaffold32266_cov73-Skeletonema_marinoi.AAC.1